MRKKFLLSRFLVLLILITGSVGVASAQIAKIGDDTYSTFADAAAAAQDGSEIVLLANIEGDITVPANVTLNGNGFAISGAITADGTITFADVTKATNFGVKYVNTVVNIPAGASLQLTGTDRMVIGHGCTFNITGSIADNAAKTADKATLTPSLVMPGASFTGAGVTFNVTNAYISAPSSYCSSSKTASGTFDFNITNSIWDSAGKLAFEAQSTAAKVDFALVNSVLTTGSHLVFATASGEEGVVIDNSLVNQGTSRQIENRGTMTIKNGAVVNGAVATSSNAINPGTIIVENATYAVTGEFSGAAEGTGTLIIKNGANVSVGSIKAGANVTVDAEGMDAGDVINFTADLSQFTGTLSVINNDNLEASIVDGKVVLAAKPAAKIGEQGYATLEAAYEAAVNGDVIVLNESVTTFPVINKAVTFEGGKENAAVEINYALSQNFTAIDGIVRFENLTFNKPLFTEHGGNKPGLSIEFEGCNFNVNSEAGYGILIGTSYSNSVVKGLKVNNCNFKYVGTEFKGGYMLYVQCVNEVTITNNTIDGNNLYRGAIHLGDATEHATVATVSNNTIKNFCRGVMMGNRKAPSSATISGNTFDNINYSDKDSKPAQECAPIFIHSNATAEALQIALTNNEVENCVNPMIYSEDTDLIKYYVTEFTGNTVAGAAVELANSYYAPNQIFPVATINDAEYFTLQAAIDAAVNGDVVTLLVDNAENVTVTQKPEVNFTIDGADKTMTGTITIDGKSAAYPTAGITVKNMNFTAATEAVCINLGVSGNNNTRYTNNVTVESCNFTGTDKTAVGIKSYTGGDKNLIVNDCIATGMHSLMQLKNTAGVSVTECEITDSKNGISLGASSDVAINKTTVVDCDGYGVRADANGNNGNATITDCTIEAFIPVVIRKASNNYGLQFSGENTMTATNEDGLWCAIGTSEYETNGTMPTAPTGQVTVTLNDTGLSMDGVYGNYYEFSGEGTAESPYLINNLYELKYFRDQVNAGVNYYEGKYVALGADINLAGENWVGIGTATADHGFMGNFDGKTFKIMNLTITDPALDSDGYAYAGFFGVTEGTDKDNQNTIKNLTIENVTISTTGQIAAAAIAYPYYTNVDNVKVCGNIAITGGNYTAGVLAYTRRCVNASNLSIVGNEGSTITGNQVVGGVISDIQMNGGLTAVYNNFNAEGITITGTKSVGGISGIIAGQTLNTCSVKNVTLACNDARVGIVSGSLGAPSTISNATYENVTGATNIIGATYDGAKAIEAKIGDTYYASLQASLNAVVEGTSNDTVELISDIDLTDVNWTPVGTETKPFIGSFNGNEHTIKNLNIVETEAAEGKAYVGLFGYAKNATIKNVVFENVNLNIACLDIDHSQGHIGAVAGSLEGTSTIENVTVKGDITVEATFDANGASRVAVVAGGNSYGDVTMKNVHVTANEGSYLKANNNVGALAGQLQGKSVFENCSSNIDVTGKKFFAGGIIGLAAGDQTFTNCHTTGNVTITAGREGRANDQYRVGGIAGGWADGKTNVCTLTECSYTGQISGTNADGSVADPLDYAGYVGRGYTLANCAGSKVVIDGVEYVQAYDTIYGIYEVNGNIEINTAVALKTVAETPSADSVSVVLGDDITLTETIKINAGQTRTATDNVVTIDLNGKTITGTDNATGSFGLIEIQPGAELIINDSSDDKSGKITLTATNDRDWNAYSSVISNQRGKLTVNGGTIEHLGGTDMAYGIDNLTNGKGTYAETIITGGTVKSTYRAIRQFLNGTEAQNILTVNGGIIEGANKSIWMQDPSKNANTGTLTVGEEANLIGNVYLYVTPNSTSWPVEVSIAAGALAEGSEIITGNVPAGYELKLVDGVYSVCSVEAKIGEVTYATLAAAVNAANEGDTITLVTDITFTEATRTLNSGSWYDGLYYIGDKSFTIDLDGYTIGHDNSVNDYLLNFKNNGAKANVINLINGTIEAGSTAYCALATSSSNTNKITINTENINIINNNSNGSTIKVRGGVELNVNAGTVITGQNSYLGIECVASTVNIYDGAEIYMNGSTSYNGCLVGACANGTVNVYGGYGEGVKGGFIAMTSGGTINVAGGEWIANTDGTVGNNSNLYVLTAQNNKNESGYAGASIINVTGGTFRGGMDAWILNDANVEKAELNISGGNFNADPTSYVVSDNYKVVNEDDGTYTVEVDGFEKFYTAAGEETTSDNAAYSLMFNVTDYANKELSVKIGNKKPAQNSAIHLVTPETVEFDNVEFNVTSVANNGFNGTSFKKVTISEGVERIGNKALFFMSKLTELVLPKTLASVGEQCIGAYNPSSVPLKSIVCYAEEAPSAFEPLSNASFQTCVEQQTILIVPNAADYTVYSNANGWKFTNILGIGSTKEIAGKDDKYTLLATVTSMNPMESSIQIGNTKPASNSNAELVLPEVVDYFPSVEGLDFTVTSIPNNAFSTCYNFTGDLEIPATVKTIGNSAFLQAYYNTLNVGKLTLNEGLKTILNSAFTLSYFNNENLVIPTTVTTIGSHAFNATNMSDTLTVQNNIPGGFSGFAGSLFTMVVVEEGVKSIVDSGSKGVFSKMSKLETVILPSTLEEIGVAAFSEDPAITTIITSATAQVPAIENTNAFDASVKTNATVWVVGNSYDDVLAYKANAKWNEFANIHLYGAVAQIGEVEYLTLNEAIAAATSGQTITLLADVEAADGNPVLIPEGVTLDINTHNVTANIYGTVKTSGGLWTTVTVPGFNSRKMLGNGAIYNTTDATVANSASEVKMLAGSIVLNPNPETEWWTLPNQNLSIASGASFEVPANIKFTVRENTHVVVDGTLTVNGVVYLQMGATVKAAAGLNILTDVEGYMVSYENGVYSVVQAIYTQTTQLIAGWNWFSYYVDTDLAELEEALGENGVQIKSKADGFRQYDETIGWYGKLNSITSEQMYQVKTNEACSVVLEGELLDNITITLHHGWNYIGYPIGQSTSLQEALDNLTPSTNDQIKSKASGNASYDTDLQMWYGGLNTLVPGEGYMYYNSSENDVTFTYNVSRSNAELKANITTDGNHWIPNAGQYPNNMTMTAMVEVEGGYYEVAAFVNGECRGSARPIYIEAMDAHILFLTIHGEDVEEMTFRYYDLATGEEFDLNDRMNYSNDAIVGTIAEPYIFSRGTTGIGEASLSEVNIYPNPTTTGTEINLQATCDTVEVFNALGVKVAEYHNVDSLDAFETAGIYVIRITNGGNVKHCSLVVK